MERRYSLSEIDQMRRSLDHVVMVDVSYRGNERREAIEDQLRSYMIAGTEPHDLHIWAMGKTQEYQSMLAQHEHVRAQMEKAPPAEATGASDPALEG